MLTYGFCLKLEFPESYGCARQLLFQTVLPISVLDKMFRQTGKPKKLSNPKMRTKTSVNIGLSVVMINYIIPHPVTLQRKGKGKVASYTYQRTKLQFRTFFNHTEDCYITGCIISSNQVWIAICSLTQVKFFPQANHTSQNCCRYCNRQHIVKIIIAFP